MIALRCCHRTLLLITLGALVSGTALPAQGGGIADVEAKLLAWATKDARRALDSVFDAKDGRSLMAMGRLLEQEGKLGEAQDRLRQATEVGKDDPMPWVYLGELRLRQEQEGPAREAFSKAADLARALIAKNGENGVAHYALGVAQQRLKNYDAAIASLERARQLRSQDPMVPFQLGVTRAFQDQWQAAFDLLGQAIDKNAGLAYAYYYRGLAAGRIKRNDLLLADFNRFLALAPHAPDADRARAIIRSASR